MNKNFVDAVLMCLVAFVLISFIRYLMIFFQKKRIEGAIDLVYREKLYDKNAVSKISDQNLNKFKKTLHKAVFQTEIYNEKLMNCLVGISAEIYSRKKIGDFLLNDKEGAEK
ncbi:hypothetical protein [Treponema pectinovorum]|uniref:hypothetical protein n=1 Tax=Treponema pectinovorum TaxID=164 RepID=UPI0011F24CEA|nr:hypothetical protein [Treponema pectinovorum]